MSLLHCSLAEAAAQAQGIAASLAQLAPHAHARRARLHALRAYALQAIDLSAAQKAVADAWSEAQEAGDDTSVGWALLAEGITPALDSPEERLVNCREALLIAQNSGERELLAGAYLLLLTELAAAGEMTELDRALHPGGALLATASCLEDETTTGWFRTFRALLDGQLPRAEGFVDAGLLTSEYDDEHEQDKTTTPQAPWLAHLALVRWLQGRIDDVESLMLRARQDAAQQTIWTALLAWVWAQQGRRVAAQALLQTLPPPAEIPPDRHWLATLSTLAVTAAELGDIDAARALYPMLSPLGDRLITMGFGGPCVGTVHQPLARLSQVLGDQERAIGHYRAAIALCAKVGAHPWLAEAQSDLAELLAHRGDQVSAAEAKVLAEEAAAAGRALRLHRCEERAASVLAILRRHAEHAAMHGGLPERRRRPVVRVLGTFEVVSLQGEEARWQSKKARELLKILIARRGAPVTRERLIDLLWPEEQLDRLYNRLAVATSTIRRALDSEAELPPNTFVQSRGDLIQLNTRLIEIDTERFLGEAKEALGHAGDAGTRIHLLTSALDGYTGEVFIDEPDASWARHYRHDVHDAFLEAAYALAQTAGEKGDHLTRVDAYRRILSFDAYEQRAHEGLIHALGALGAHGQASTAEAEYEQRMRELDIDAKNAGF